MLPCPNGCPTVQCLKSTVDAHRAVCPRELVLCEYAPLGCLDKLLRSEKAQHDVEAHDKHGRLMKQHLANLAARGAAAVAPVKSARAVVQVQQAPSPSPINDRPARSTTLVGRGSLATPMRAPRH